MCNIRRPDFSPIPASRTSREAFLDDLINQGAELTLHTGTSLLAAHALHMSDVADFYESTAFGNYRKGMEAKQKLHIATIERIDGVSKQVNGLGASLARFVKALAGR